MSKIYINKKVSVKLSASQLGSFVLGFPRAEKKVS